VGLRKRTTTEHRGLDSPQRSWWKKDRLRVALERRVVLRVRLFLVLRVDDDAVSEQDDVLVRVDVGQRPLAQQA
jgi:hypothetical protein